MADPRSKVLRLRRDLLERAHAAASGVTNGKHSDAEAIEVCVACCTQEAFARMAEAVNAKLKAGVIANTAAAVEFLTGETVEVKVDGDRWWLALAGEGKGFPLGSADPGLVATEMAKLGRGLDLQASVQ